ncbi:MAG: FkbM family methyltransferase [Sterolibacterium sp.]
MAVTDKLQEPLAKLIGCIQTGNADQVISAALEVARESGRMRAQDLLQTGLVRRSDAMIFDVGANIGSSSVTYRQMFPDATIHAFEPHPQVFDRLRQQFVDDRKVIVNNCGVADRSGSLQFNLANDLGSSSFLAISPTSPYVRGIGLSTVETREVAVTSIDEYCRAQGIGHIDFMKLDVQGFERKVLDGASGMLARHAIGAIQTEIVFRDFYTESSSFFEIEECLHAHGYTLRCIYDIYPAEGAQIFQCDAIYAYVPDGDMAPPIEDDQNKLVSEAMEHHGSGRLDEAHGLYLRILERSPENWSLLALAGSIDLEYGRNERARDLLGRAVTIEPQNEEVLLRLGMAHLRLGEEEQAIGCLHRLGSNGMAQLMLGQLHATAGDHGAAVVALSKARRAGALDVDEHLALALFHSGEKRGAEALLRQLVHPERRCGRWLAMTLGKLLVDEGRGEEARQYFTLLSRSRPELVDVAATVLADVELLRGEPARALEILAPVMHSVWSRTFVCSSLARLGMLLRDSGGEARRQPHPFPNSTAGVAITSLESYGRFAHQLQEYLFMRWQADTTGVVLETPDWVGHLVFELDDPYPTGQRRQVQRSSNWIEKEVFERGAQALAGYDFFSPGTFGQWQPAHVDLARRLFKLRPGWQAMLEPPLATLREGHQTLVAIHLRRTDQKGRCKLPDNRWYLDWLRQAWPGFANPVLYIASDDLDEVLGDFAEFSPRCVRDLPGFIPGLEWLHDFHVIMNADAAAISQSAFSYVACMLNSRGHTFKQPDMANACLADYHPSRHDMLRVVAP